MEGLNMYGDMKVPHMITQYIEGWEECWGTFTSNRPTNIKIIKNRLDMM